MKRLYTGYKKCKFNFYQMSILQTVHSLTKYETPLVNLSPHPSLTLPYKGGKRSSFYD
jgi:hypothetical protein